MGQMTANLFKGRPGLLRFAAAADPTKAHLSRSAFNCMNVAAVFALKKAYQCAGRGIFNSVPKHEFAATMRTRLVATDFDRVHSSCPGTGVRATIHHAAQNDCVTIGLRDNNAPLPQKHISSRQALQKNDTSVSQSTDMHSCPKICNVRRPTYHWTYPLPRRSLRITVRPARLPCP